MRLGIASAKRAVWVALWLFLLQTYWGASLALNITRGESDSVFYGQGYQRMVNRTNLATMNCNVTAEKCWCDTEQGYKTIIYNQTSNIVSCVTDEDLVMFGNDISGKYIKLKSKGKCLRVKGQGIVEVNCSENDLSLRWLWIPYQHLLNVKTLKCLQWNKSSKNFTIAQCNEGRYSQQWSVDRNGRISLNTGNFKAKELDSTMFPIKPTPYQGYEMLAVIKQNAAEKITRTINAPIFKDRICQINLTVSKFSTFGGMWQSFSDDRKLFRLDPAGGDKTVILNIDNSSRLFEGWSGTLIKLGIECHAKSENYCVILKIESAGKNKTPNTTPPLVTTSSSATLSTTPLATSSPASSLSSTPTSSPTPTANKPSAPVKKDSKMSSMLYIIPIVVLICLLIATFIIIFICRRRKRKRVNSKEELHHYEESTAYNPKVKYEDPIQLTKVKQPPNSYDKPGTTIPSGSFYDEPASGPPPPNSKQNPANNNNLQYDYATREETSLLPLILRGDVTFTDDPPELPKPRKTGQPTESPYYHTLDNDSSKKNDSNAGESDGNPLYHTLEAKKSDESHPGKENDGNPLYHTSEAEKSDQSHPGKENDAKEKNSGEKPPDNTPLENTYEEIGSKRGK